MTTYQDFVYDIQDALFPAVSDWKLKVKYQWDDINSAIEAKRSNKALNKELINEYYIDIAELRTIQLVLTKLNVLLEEL